MSLGVVVQDDVLNHPLRYRDWMLSPSSRRFKDVTIGPDTFKGICQVLVDFNAFTEWLRSQGLESTLSFLRLSQKGQPEPNFIHHDAMMGDWTAILYLNTEPHPRDGTVFWQHDSGVNGAPYDWTDVDMHDSSQFTERFRVKAQFNRAVIFPSKWFHSRALFENYGEGDNARLIQVAFGKVV